jgi:hypothetical protein
MFGCQPIDILWLLRSLFTGTGPSLRPIIAD